MATDRKPEILLLHGPNLNLLGERDPAHYGRVTLAELVEQVRAWAAEAGLGLRAVQSNHEGTLIDTLQDARRWARGAIVNAGALTHTSYSLHDALLDFARPVAEVHLSAVSEREAWRRTSVLRPACGISIEGEGPEGYRRAIVWLAKRLVGPSETS